jgi:hypothetical protein
VTATWDALEALAADEAIAVSEARFDDLPALYDRRSDLLAALPTPLPAESIEPLRRALAMQQTTATALRARRDALATELGKLHRGRAGVRGYARTFDVRP